jgi:hypothetical protein
MDCYDCPVGGHPHILGRCDRYSDEAAMTMKPRQP